LRERCEKVLDKKTTLGSDMKSTLYEDEDLPVCFPGNDRIALVVKRGDRNGNRPLHPEEELLVSPRAVAKRRGEFLLGRAAAHGAIRSLLGDSPHPVRKGTSGEPLWPEGLVGSITHSGDTAAAAVGRRREAEGIGIDLEALSKRVSFNISRKVCTEHELRWVLGTEDPGEKNLRLRMLFSAKESVYKALFPAGRVFLGFQDAELAWDSRERRFLGRLLKQAGPAFPCGYAFTVGCRRTREFVFTFLWLPPAGG
jgi:enterobactin synthetase component D